MPDAQTAQPTAPAVHGTRRAGRTVTVACKMPNGVILRAWEMVPHTEPLFGGGARETSVAVPVMDPSNPLSQWEFTVRGNAIDIAKASLGDLPNLAHGYSLTPGVPRELWEKWIEANKHAPMVKNNLIYALDDEASARDWSREHQKVRSGLEPIDPAAPGRAVPGIEKAVDA